MHDGNGEDVRGGRAAGRRVLTPRGLRTRAGLLAAARTVFDSTPFADARLLDITNEARVSAGTFYTYFDDKEEIFREVAAEVLAELSDAPRQALRHTSGDPIEGIAEATRQYFHACLRNAVVVRSMEQLATRDSAINAARRSTVTLGVKRAALWIEELRARGVCDDDIDPWMTAMVLHTMTVRVAYDHLLMTPDDSDVETLVEAVTHVWTRAVRLE